jgi:hypothetical protein
LSGDEAEGLVVTTLGIVLAVVVAAGILGLVAVSAALFYVVSFRVGPSYRQIQAAPGLEVEEIGRALDGAVRVASGRLPPAVQAKVAEIRREILELLPSTAMFPLGSEDVYVIQRTATDYLPSTLDAYLALPEAYATRQVLPDGRTPLQLLGDQLQLLDDRLDEITEAINHQDLNRLVANGRFLEERFGQRSEGLALPPPE